MIHARNAIAALFIGACALPVYAADTDMAKSVDKQFKAQDADHDGKLSPKECADGAKKMFQTMDGDKNGRVTANEMDNAQEKITGKKGGTSDLSSAEKIKMVDANGDGTLTAIEHAEGAKQMFALMDLDTDGYLTKDELFLGHQEMLQKDARR